MRNAILLGGEEKAFAPGGFVNVQTKLVGHYSTVPFRVTGCLPWSHPSETIIPSLN